MAFVPNLNVLGINFATLVSTDGASNLIATLTQLPINNVTVGINAFTLSQDRSDVANRFVSVASLVAVRDSVGGFALNTLLLNSAGVGLGGGIAFAVAAGVITASVTGSGGVTYDHRIQWSIEVRN